MGVFECLVWRCELWVWRVFGMPRFSVWSCKLDSRRGVFVSAGVFQEVSD